MRCTVVYNICHRQVHPVRMIQVRLDHQCEQCGDMTFSTTQELTDHNREEHGAD
jgi:hypothetical protein